MAATGPGQNILFIFFYHFGYHCIHHFLSFILPSSFLKNHFRYHFFKHFLIIFISFSFFHFFIMCFFYLFHFFIFLNHFFIFFYHVSSFLLPVVQTFSKKWKIAIFLGSFHFFHFCFIIFHHFCFQRCTNLPKNGKLQFSPSVFFIFLIIFSFF